VSFQYFRIGQTVFHKAHGVGQITAVETRTFSGKATTFYIVEIVDCGLPKKVFVPVEFAKDRITLEGSKV
jgi:RNA polymerase-interacting CarD/CdnL/TRCF family regulator